MSNEYLEEIIFDLNQAANKLHDENFTDEFSKIMEVVNSLQDKQTDFSHE